MTPSDQIIPYGYCHCGCGQKTTVQRKTSAKEGYVKGEPCPYLPLHRQTAKRAPSYSGKVDGDEVIFIPLTKGQWAIVDATDYASLAQWQWFAMWQKTSGRYYAARNSPVVKGKRGKPILMHREIMGMLSDDEYQVDHVKPELTLDNRHRNLRIATPSQNRQNTHKRRDNTSGYKGVSRASRSMRWRASIQVGGVAYDLGVHDTPELAHQAYCEAARRLHGEFARFE